MLFRSETAGGGEPDAVLHSVAPDRAHLADAYGDAGAVAVAQAQLDIVPEVLGIDGVFLLDMLTQGTNGPGPSPGRGRGISRRPG